jgi:hypothetical protein
MDSKKYIGMDVHKEATTVAVMNAASNIALGRNERPVSLKNDGCTRFAASQTAFPGDLLASRRRKIPLACRMRERPESPVINQGCVGVQENWRLGTFPRLVS